LLYYRYVFDNDSAAVMLHSIVVIPEGYIARAAVIVVIPYKLDVRLVID